jgi:hypothetical protein
VNQRHVAGLYNILIHINATNHKIHNYNGDMSEAITFGTQQKLRYYPSLTGISTASFLVTLSNTIQTLSITLDRHLTLDTHVSSVCKFAFYHIRALRHIRNSLTDVTAKAVAVALVQSQSTTATLFYTASLIQPD